MEKLNVIDKLTTFAAKHGLILETEGECGFGRDCVGFVAKNGNYVDYNPMCEPDCDYIKETYDERFYESATPNAYHKHNCFCVLGHGEAALEELNTWVDNLLNDGELEVVAYKTGATGMQAMLSGTIGYTLKFKSQ